MSTQPEQAKAEILDRIVATINEKVPEERREQVASFARQYYQRTAPEDLLERDPDDLYGAVLAHWRAAQLPGSRSTAGARPTRSWRSSPTTCRSWSTR